MHSKISHIFLGFSLVLSSSPSIATAESNPEAVDLQFFGDVMLSAKSVAQTQSSPRQPNIFAASIGLLNSAKHNVANLEGVITDTPIPYEYKHFLLPMPIDSGDILSAARIDIVTLANNHAMDFGFQGLLSTVAALSRSGITYGGAGINAAAAAAPVLIRLPRQTVCLLAFSRTLPISFWANKGRAGTASATPKSVSEQVSACAAAGYFTVAAFHWGQEERSSPMAYQIELAHLAIDAGASLVIGHHPHRLQNMEVYRGRPILYSLGNFAFGSEPAQDDQSGLAVRLRLPRSEGDQTLIDLVPLEVSNSLVRFVPRPSSRAEADEFRAFLPKEAPCRRRHSPERWTCRFKPGPT